jgi:RimJ/RimL family protein N-acetyltransferase
MKTTSTSGVDIREATSADIPQMKHLIFSHGPSLWNFLPEAEVSAHLDRIGSGDAEALLAFDGDRLIGMVSFSRVNPLSGYEPEGAAPGESGYIAEGVVARDHAGMGLGTELLVRACQRLCEYGVRRIYVKRHEENLASAGSLRKAGFVEIETFDDPARRPYGSRRTTVCRYDV